MASVSLVGPGPGPQHRAGGAEPPTQLLFFKVTSSSSSGAAASGGGRKKSSTRENKKMMFRKNSVSCSGGGSTELPGAAAAAAPPEKRNRSAAHSATSPPGRGGGGGMPGTSSTLQPAHAPRSPASQGAEDRCCDSRRTGGGDTGGDSDCNSNCVDCCDSNLNAGGGRTTTTRRNSSSAKGTAVTNNVMQPSAHQGANNGHNTNKAVQRDVAAAPNGRHHHRQNHASPPVTTNGQRGASATSANGSATPVGGGGLSLERLTQGRTGVVRYARTERPRLEAWSIFPLLLQPDPRVRAESGEGHRFEPKLPVSLAQEDWCDACGRQIAALALKCQNCSYTCHLECESRVQLDCNQRDGEPTGTPSPRSHRSTGPQHKQNEAKEKEVSGTETKALSEEEVRSRIEEYNAQVSENGMKLATDGSYTGFIKVHLRLSRPVTVPERDAPGRPGSASGEGGPEGTEGSTGTGGDRRTSFYLPSDCVKQLHIASLTTVKEVIQGLLKKFMVLDNPRKFALYRQTHRDGQDLFQKLPLGECPLALRLMAGTDSDLLTFVLKENETTEVEWHAFSVPELQNFLVILEKEEAERVHVVEHKYSVYRQKLQKALQQHNP